MNTGGCSICQDTFTWNSEGVSVLRCGHLYHINCIARWLVGHPSCPQCRVTATYDQIIPLYFTHGLGDREEEESTPEYVQQLKQEIRSAQASNDELRSKIKTLENKLEEKTMNLDMQKGLLSSEKTVSATLREQLGCFRKEAKDAKAARKETLELRKELENYRLISRLINNPDLVEEDIRVMAGGRTADQLIEWQIVLNRELKAKRRECSKLNTEIVIARRNTATFKAKLVEAELAVRAAEVAQKKAEEDLERLRNEPTQTPSSKDWVDIRHSSSIIRSSQRRNPSPAEVVYLADSPDVLSPLAAKRMQLNNTIDLTESPENVERKRTPLRSSNTIGFGGYNILKPRGTTFIKDKESSITVGYNGMGGTESFVKPRVSQVKKPQRPKTTSSRKNPPLPTLDTFMETD